MSYEYEKQHVSYPYKLHVYTFVDNTNVNLFIYYAIRSFNDFSVCATCLLFWNILFLLSRLRHLAISSPFSTCSSVMPIWDSDSFSTIASEGFYDEVWQQAPCAAKAGRYLYLMALSLQWAICVHGIIFLSANLRSLHQRLWVQPPFQPRDNFPLLFEAEMYRIQERKIAWLEKVADHTYDDDNHHHLNINSYTARAPSELFALRPHSIFIKYSQYFLTLWASLWWWDNALCKLILL